jgi:hypothetical protein
MKKIASVKRSIFQQKSSHGYFTLSLSTLGFQILSFNLCSLVLLLCFVFNFCYYHFSLIEK